MTLIAAIKLHGAIAMIDDSRRHGCSNGRDVIAPGSTS